MSYETAVISTPDGLVEVRAYGGNRRQRGAKIGAEVRRQAAAGRTLECYHRSYDEAYGFMPMSLAKYRVLAKPDSVE
jgi:hypothetical protein